MYRRLTAAHPTMEKLNKLFKFMDELNLSIEIGAYGSLSVVDKENGTFDLMDNETHVGDNYKNPITSLPPWMEFKMVREVNEVSPTVPGE